LPEAMAVQEIRLMIFNRSNGGRSCRRHQDRPTRTCRDLLPRVVSREPFAKQATIRQLICHTANRAPGAPLYELNRQTIEGRDHRTQSPSTTPQKKRKKKKNRDHGPLTFAFAHRALSSSSPSLLRSVKHILNDCAHTTFKKHRAPDSYTNSADRAPTVWTVL